MDCEHVNIGGATAIICSRGRRRPKCSVGLCGRASVALCDYPVERKGKKASCDSPMCALHRHPVPGEIDTDWCEGHWRQEQRQPHRAEFYADLYDVPIDEIERRYGLALVGPVRASQEAEGVCAKVTGG